MGLRLASTLRATRNQDIIAAAGAAAKMKFFGGPVPATGAAPSGALLGTLVFGSALGTTTNAVLTFGAVTQNNSTHVAGTPTFARIEKADGTFVADVDIGSGAGNMTFTGTIANGTDISLGASTITEGNA